MADRVRFILDRLAAFFNQLSELDLLNDAEVKSVVKRITDYEYLMMRREMHESDVTPYIEFAINFDKLLSARISTHKSGNYKEKDTIKGKEWLQLTRRTASILVSHISYVFDRVIRRFPKSILLWDAYLRFLTEKDARSQLNAVYGRVLSLHPEVERFWIQAAAHELTKNQNIHSARVLLQRALRANKNSQVLWLKYFDVEVFNASKVTTRKRSLSISTDNTALLGVPLVVLRHALKSIPENVPFAFEFLTRASAVSQLLADKVIEFLDSHFAGSLEFWKHRIVNFLQFTRAVDGNNSNNSSNSSHMSTCSNNLALEAREPIYKFSSTHDIVDDSLSIAAEAFNLIGLMRNVPISETKVNVGGGNGGSVSGAFLSDSLNVIEMDSLEMIVARSMAKFSSISERTQSMSSKRSRRPSGIIIAHGSESIIDQNAEVQELKKTVSDKCLQLLSGSKAGDKDSAAYELLKLKVTSLSIQLRLDMMSYFLHKDGTEASATIPSELPRLKALHSITTEINSFIQKTLAKSLLTEGLVAGLFDRVCHYLILVLEYYTRVDMLQLSMNISSSEMQSIITNVVSVVSTSPFISQSRYIAYLYRLIFTCHSYKTSLVTHSSGDDSFFTSMSNVLMNAITSPKTDQAVKSQLLESHLLHSGADSHSKFLQTLKQVESSLNKNPSILPSLSLDPFYTTALDIAEGFVSSVIESDSSTSSASSSSTSSALIKEISSAALKRCPAGPSSARFTATIENVLRSTGDFKEANLIKWKGGK